MYNKFSKCQKCPAFGLLTEERKKQIERWEYKRENYLKRTKLVRLILLGESMPASRYFYDIDTYYEGKGLRYTLKKEFDKLDISDSQFLISMARKGIVLFDLALCPLHRFNKRELPEININKLKRLAATYCFQTITKNEIEKYPDVPIVTVFPSNRGWLKNDISSEIKERVKGEYSFSDQTGLANFYEEKIRTPKL